MPQLVTINEKILGGKPVISGTRIPVERLKYLIESGYTVENLKEEFPHINKKKISSVMAFLLTKGIDAFEREYAQTSG